MIHVHANVEPRSKPVSVEVVSAERPLFQLAREKRDTQQACSRNRQMCRCETRESSCCSIGFPLNQDEEGALQKRGCPQDNQTNRENIISTKKQTKNARNQQTQQTSQYTCGHKSLNMNPFPKSVHVNLVALLFWAFLSFGVLGFLDLFAVFGIGEFALVCLVCFGFARIFVIVVPCIG